MYTYIHTPALHDALPICAGVFKVKVRLSDERDGSFEGTLDFAENRVDEGTGTMRVRAVFDNPDLVMQPGLFGIINIPGSLRSEEHTSELQSLMRISYAVFCLKQNIC